MNADQMKELVELCRHEAIAGKRGEIQFGDFAWYPEIKRIGTLSPYIEHNQFVWLPPVYDYQHPERGLIGMLTGSGIFGMDLEWQPGLIDGDGWRVSINWYKDIHQFIGATPGTALAKAIIWQYERRERC